jgi:serine protease inhibitor
VSDCEILGLPYKQNATTMYVILPKNSNPDKIRAAQKILSAEKIEKMISLMTIKTAVILFPKMHMSCGHYLKAELQDIGLNTLFEPFASDLSVLSNGNSLLVRGNSTQNLNEQLIFGRTGMDESPSRRKRDVTYKVPGEGSNQSPLSMKDFMLRKRIVKKGLGKKLRRSKRQYTPFAAERLDMIRHRKDLQNPQLFAEEVIHKVDLTINEKGTEGGAATAISLNRSGTKVVFRVDTPFMFLIRHDPTRLALFYGVVFEPQNQ